MEQDAGFVFTRKRKRNDASNDSIVPLPISDTPIIRRNQTMRQTAAGRRRSSLTMRGKRASSIGNGFEAMPHPDIARTEFYKHVSAEMPEPIRMKQLLIWCARRALVGIKDVNKQEDVNPGAIARVICDEIVRDLMEGKITTSWYSRDENTSDQAVVMIKKPHPRNEDNLAKEKTCKELLARLSAEKVIWRRLVNETPTVIHESMAEAEDSKIAESSLPIPPVAAMEVEVQIDKLYHSLYSVHAFNHAANHFASQCLQDFAGMLNVKSNNIKKKAGTSHIDTMSVMRGVTRT